MITPIMPKRISARLVPKLAVVPMIVMALFSFGLLAQTITGTVSDGETGDPLPGVTVVVKNTTNGALTDFEGKYRLEISSPEDVIAFSFLGYESQEVAVGSQRTIDVTLNFVGLATDEVVITALGVKKSTKALGYSVTEVDGGELTEARESNVVKSLAGKVAGVQVTGPSSGPAGSSRVIIRGNSSLGGNNQPLYVVDGVPIDNSSFGQAGMWGGTDLGDGISSINPDDIETISVLKGPSATALYGTRAQNGVILITTKRGNNRQGIGVEINSNMVFENPLTFYDGMQQIYGSGTRGAAPISQEEALQTARSSWGAKMEGQSVIQFDGENRPYEAHPDNMNVVFGTGTTLTNTVALTSGNENATLRLSVSDLRNKGMFENQNLNRNTYTLRSTGKMGKKLSTDVKVNYIHEDVDNRPGLSDTPFNPGHLGQVASSVDFNAIKATAEAAKEGMHIPYNTSQFRSNPYYGVYDQFNGDVKDRIIGFISARYEFTDWLSLQLRGGSDFYRTRRTTWDGEETPYLNRPGRMGETTYNVREDNRDFLFMLNKNIGSDISVQATFGGNQLYRRFESLSQSGTEFIVPGLRSIRNLKFQNQGYGFNEKKINSLYGSAQVGYKDYIFLDLTARNDWSSTLPEAERSYFYPSASLSFAFSDAFNLSNDVFNFGKVRLSYAQVGGDTDPYQLLLTYSIVGQPHLGNPQGQIAQGRIPLADLKPTNTISYEAGVDLRFFQNKLGLDVAYYKMNTKNQILNTNISPTSGYGSVTVNAGELQNEGVEVLLTTNPVSLDNGFRWDLGINFARNRNTVVALDDEGKLSALRLGESRQRNTFVEARVGQPYGSIVGYAYARDAQGRVIHDVDGLPLAADTLSVLGTGVPDFTGGITNTFSFKGFTLSALIDIRWGGSIHSKTNLDAYAGGQHLNTLEGRESWAQSEAERIAAGVDPADWTPTGGIVGEGVTESGEVNSVYADPQLYFGRIASRVSEEFIYSADMIKLRQATFSYTIPRGVTQRTPFQGITVSVVGRNLAFLHKKIPNIDPESNYSNGNAQGLEYATLPTSRSVGVNLNLKF